MKRKRTVAMTVFLLSVAIVLGGCGGGGSKRLTKEQFAAKADALCAAYNKHVNSSKPYLLPPSC